MKPRRLLILILLIASASGVYYWRTSETAKTEQVALPSVAAAMGDVEEAVLASGALEPVRQVSVGAQATGRIVSLNVKLGDNVEAGALIAEIDGVTQQNSLRSAEADLAALKAQREERRASLSYAQSVLARQRQMISQNAVSRDAFENAQMTVLTTQAQIEALDAQIVSGEVKVDGARATLGYTRIKAPIAGTVLAVVTQEGQTVNSVQSAPTIVVLGDVSIMNVKAKISEADVLRVKAGQEVYFSVLGAPEQRFPGKISVVEPAPDALKTQNANSSSSTASSTSSSTAAIYYNAIFETPNPDGRLLTSMTTQVTVIVGRARNVVTIPSTAIRRRGDNMFVEVLDEIGRPVRRNIKVGLDNKIVAEIKDGLKAGERVVTARAGGGPDATRAQRARRSPFGF